MSIVSLISEINSPTQLSGAMFLGVITFTIGGHVQKSKVFGLFFYNTPLKIWILNIFALIARRSKYDFWIPDEILTLETKNQIKNIFFRDRKFWSKKFPPSKNQFLVRFFLYRFFRFLDGKIFLVRKNFRFFFRSKFSISKIIFLIWIFISRVKISSGIQKSYLERRAMSATMRKMQFLEGVS